MLRAEVIEFNIWWPNAETLNMYCSYYRRLLHVPWANRKLHLLENQMVLFNIVFKWGTERLAYISSHLICVKMLTIITNRSNTKAYEVGQ